MRFIRSCRALNPKPETPLNPTDPVGPRAVQLRSSARSATGCGGAAASAPGMITQDRLCSSFECRFRVYRV